MKINLEAEAYVDKSTGKWVLEVIPKENFLDLPPLKYVGFEDESEVLQVLEHMTKMQHSNILRITYKGIEL
jgi:hypothetical protein